LSPAGALRILLVEDDFLVGLQLEEDLRAAGHIVLGPYRTLDSATDAARREVFALAILDVNLHGLPVFPLADEIAQRGLPVILLTGYQMADLPRRFQAVPHLTKPYAADRLAEEIARLTS